MKANATSNLYTATGTAGSETSLNIDFTDPVQNLDAFTRVIADTNPDNVSVGWFGGPCYAVIGDSSKLQPLFSIEGIGISTTQKLENSAIRIFNRELVFYKDLRSGEFLETWINPLNSETCQIFDIHNMTMNAELAPVMTMHVEGEELRYPFLPPWEVMGNIVLSTFERHTSGPSKLLPDEWPKESPGPLSRMSEMYMRYVQTHDLSNREMTSVPYIGTWTYFTAWFPWMLMAQAEGSLFMRCAMKKHRNLSDLPKNFLNRAERMYPEYLKPPSPSSWGQPNDSVYAQYKQARVPIA